MIKEDFYKVIVLEIGSLVPLSFLAPAYGTTTAHLDPDDLLHKLLRKWMTLHEASLFDWIFTLVCPNHTDDPPTAIHNVRQSYMDHQGDTATITTDKYISNFMRTLHPLALMATATITYAAQLIDGLSQVLRDQVESEFTRHQGTQCMNRAYQMTLLQEAV